MHFIQSPHKSSPKNYLFNGHQWVDEQRSLCGSKTWMAYIGVVPLTRPQLGGAQLLGIFHKFLSQQEYWQKNDLNFETLWRIIFAKLNFPQKSNWIISPVSRPPPSHKDNPFKHFFLDVFFSGHSSPCFQRTNKQIERLRDPEVSSNNGHPNINCSTNGEQEEDTLFDLEEYEDHNVLNSGPESAYMSGFCQQPIHILDALR